jgi:hypothetical protein
MLADIFDSIVLNFHTGQRIFIGQYDACLDCASEHSSGILCVVLRIR